MRRDSLRQAANVLAYVATVVVNVLANALPLNGQTTGEIANRFPVLIVPAGYVFSIWGVIYLFLGAFVVYQALPRQRENPYLRRIGYLFVLASAANIAWLFFWHYNLFVLSLVAMLTLLGSLIAIYLRLGIGRVRTSTAEKWLVQIPFSIYLGWITVATITNVAVVLFVLNWDQFGLSAETWTVIVLFVGAGIASAVAATRADVAYVLVILWAYAGIAVRQQANTTLVTATGVAAGIVLIVLIVTLLLRWRRAGRAW